MKGTEEWGRLGMERMEGNQEQRVREAGSGRRHDRGSEKGKGFLVPRLRVPSPASACFICGAVDILAYKKTSFGGFGSPFLGCSFSSS